MIQENRNSVFNSFDDPIVYAQHSGLQQHLRVEESRHEARHQLAQISGIRNESVLNDLLGHDITAPVVAALPLVPLFLIAWADGGMEPAEREAILKAMDDHDLIPSQPAYEFLRPWLDEAPDSSLFDIWNLYVRGVHDAMETQDFDSWKQRILDRAEFIAAAAGGFMGIGFRISSSEKAMLRFLENSFEL